MHIFGNCNCSNIPRVISFPVLCFKGLYIRLKPLVSQEDTNSKVLPGWNLDAFKEWTLNITK